jgi:multidrug resistance efflux pump
MIRKYLLPLVAVAGVVFAIYVVKGSNKPIPASQPVAQPAAAPFKSYIAGAGIVEARTENLPIGTGEGGTVIAVHVKPGDRVTKGQPLFQIRNFTQKAEVEEAKGRVKEAEAAVEQARAAVARSEADLLRLAEFPRPEEVPPAQAKVTEAEAALADVTKQLELWEEIYAKDKRAVSEDDLVRRRYAVKTAAAKLEAARADLALLKAGTWKRDIDVAKAKVTEARAAVAGAEAGVVTANGALQAAEARLEKLTIKAPTDATVLQVKIHEGELAPNTSLATPLMVLGDIDTLVVRVDVDENDAWRFKEGARAAAFVRGNRDLFTDVTFARVEPYVVPKKSLTGESTERVDTRVLQVLYSFPRSALPVYVGQQMDVFIEAAPVTPGGTTRAATTAQAAR